MKKESELLTAVCTWSFFRIKKNLTNFLPIVTGKPKSTLKNTGILTFLKKFGQIQKVSLINDQKPGAWHLFRINPESYGVCLHS